MNESLITTIGLIAGTACTGAWLPQVWQTVKTRSAKDFSWSYLALFASGVSLWLVYGIGKRDLVIALANGVTLALVIVIVVVKMRER